MNITKVTITINKLLSKKDIQDFKSILFLNNCQYDLKVESNWLRDTYYFTIKSNNDQNEKIISYLKENNQMKKDFNKILDAYLNFK